MANLSENTPYGWRHGLKDYTATAIFCTAIAITLWLLDLAEPLWASFVVSFSIGFSINTVSLLAHPLMIRWLPPMIAPVPTTLIGVGVGVALAGALTVGDPLFFFNESYSALVLGLFFGVLGFVFFSTRQRLNAAEAALTTARARQLAGEKAHLETQLQLLQAQIEPHFLFNTLSNVAGMIHADPDQAEKMLLNLTTLLRATLRRTRDGAATLGDELEILEALLAINQVRMGNRLHYSITAEPDLKAHPLPPMLVQPLVENAIKHGIDPLETGGEIHVSASCEGDQLLIRVADTGAGVNGGSPGTGVGLSNVQARLATLFEGRAHLALEDNSPRGMIATMWIPTDTS